MKNYSISITQCRGLTLIELMIAMVLGLMLLLAATGLFDSNKRIYKEQNNMGRLQENARYALDLLVRDIRMAGYSGCADDVSNVSNDVDLTDAGISASISDLLDFSNSIEGINDVVISTSTWPSGSTANVTDMVAGTDAITLRFLSPTGISIDSPMPTTAKELKVTSVGDLQEDDIIAISDCDSADIFQLTEVQTSSLHLQHNPGNSNTPGNVSGNMSKKYNEDATILRMVNRRYFIGTGAGGGPSLFRIENLAAAPVELVEGVENLQILYGVDTNGNGWPNTYVAAGTAPLNTESGWSSVVSVRLALLMQTVDQNFSIDPDTRTYDLLGDPTTTADDYDPTDDFRKRRVITTTIQVRNRSS